MSIHNDECRPCPRYLDTCHPADDLSSGCPLSAEWDQPDEGATLAHADDACEAVGIAVLDLLADGAESIIVRRDSNGGYIVEAAS
jgi:hypothetical protein